MVRNYLEQLFEFAAKSIPSEQIFEAKKSYQKETGEIYEDDKSYNTRMTLFLEWYLFDNYQEQSSKNILEVLLEENPESWNADQIKNFNNFNENIQGLFLVKKVKGDSVKVLNLFTNQIHLVQEKDSGLIFRKNNIFQGRIIYFQNQYYFTGNFCFHPEKTHKFIIPEVKNIEKILSQHNNDLIKIKKKLHKANKILKKFKIDINKLNEIIKNTSSINKIEKLNQKLKNFHEEQEKQIQITQEFQEEVFNIENNKIKFEGRIKINELLNRFAYMNLKWERSRQIDISDIYKN
tara:strand:+ start:244 stop:1119 length:876 start_codon:yes stop_codon:yes gene_type:complete